MKKLLLLMVLSGCYQSHEIPVETSYVVCETLEDCPTGQYCELRFFCLENDDGSVDCDPFRDGFGCSFLEGQIVCDDPFRSTGMGICLTPQICEDVFESSRYPCSQVEVN